MAARVERLPYGIGRFTVGWFLLIGILLAFVMLGIFAYARQFTEGLILTGMHDIGSGGGSAWGLYITFDIYFVGVSFSGITMAAMIRLLHLEQLRPVSRMAELLTIVSLLMAGLVIIPDLGRPLRGLVNLFLYARPMSPFFGTFTLVISGYLFASLTYFYLDARRDAAICARRSEGGFHTFYRLWAAGYMDTEEERERHNRTTFWLAVAILPLLITAHSTLGFVFGVLVGRPGWFGALQAPGFVVMAGVSGVGVLIIIAGILRRTLNVRDQLNLEIFKWLGNLLMVLTLAYLYFMIVEWLTTTYSADYHERKITVAILSGSYAGIFWISVTCLVMAFGMLFLQFASGGYNIGATVFSGFLVNIAAIGKRFLIVAPSQTHGSLLPYKHGLYAPTWVEYSIVLGLVALGALLYAIFIKIFPVLEVPETAEGDP